MFICKKTKLTHFYFEGAPLADYLAHYLIADELFGRFRFSRNFLCYKFEIEEHVSLYIHTLNYHTLRILRKFFNNRGFYAVPIISGSILSLSKAFVIRHRRNSLFFWLPNRFFKWKAYSFEAKASNKSHFHPRCMCMQAVVNPLSNNLATDWNMVFKKQYPLIVYFLKSCVSPGYSRLGQRLWLSSITSAI